MLYDLLFNLRTTLDKLVQALLLLAALIGATYQLVSLGGRLFSELEMTGAYTCFAAEVVIPAASLSSFPISLLKVSDSCLRFSSLRALVWEGQLG